MFCHIHKNGMKAPLMLPLFDLSPVGWCMTPRMGTS